MQLVTQAEIQILKNLNHKSSYFQEKQIKKSKLLEFIALVGARWRIIIRGSKVICEISIHKPGWIERNNPIIQGLRPYPNPNREFTPSPRYVPY